MAAIGGSRRRSPILKAMTRHVVDYSSDSSLASRARQRRWTQLMASFPNLSRLRVVDLGGTVEHWTHAPVRPASVTVVNLAGLSGSAPSWIEVVQADACDPP